MREYRRIFFRKELAGCILILFCINLALFFQEQEKTYGPVRQQFGVSMEEIRLEAQRQIAKLASKDPDAVLVELEELEKQEPGSFREDLSYYVATKEILPMLRSQNMCLEYQKQVQENVKRLTSISLFQKQGSFSKRNIEKTAKDFASTAEVTPVPGYYHAVSAALEYRGTGYLLLIFLVFFVLSFMEERKKGLWGVIHLCAGGRYPLAGKRLGALCLGFALTALLLYGSVFAAGWLYYGPCELDVPVQSLAGLARYPVTVNIASFLLRYVTFWFFGLLLLGLCFWVILSLFDQFVIGAILAGAILAAEYALFFFVPAQSRWNLLKYINLCSYLFPQTLYDKYLNMNLFGSPVNNRELLAGLLPILLLVSGAAGIIVNGARRPEKRPNLLTRLLDWCQKKSDGLIGCLPGWGMELYKILFAQRGIVLLLVLLLFCVSGIPEKTKYPKGDPADWIMGDLNAPYDSEKVTSWLEEKQGAIDKADENYRQAQLDLEQGLISQEKFTAISYEMSDIQVMNQFVEEIRQRVMSLEQAEQETGIKGWVINDRSYEHLIGLEFENIVVLRRLSLLTLFALTMLVTPVFVFDRQCGTDRLIHETGKGKRGVFLRKQTAVFLLTVITFVIIYGSRTVTVARQWDLSGLEAPLQSIRWFMRYPLRISIGGFLLLQGILQIAMMYAAAQIMLAFSLFFQKITGALAVNLVIFVVPAALWCVGNGLLPIWNFGSLLSVSETLYGPYYETGLSHILTYVGMAFCGLAAFLFSAGQVGKG